MARTAVIAEIDTDTLEAKTAAYAKAQTEAFRARRLAEEKEAARLKAHSEMLAVMQPNKPGPKAKGALVA